MIIELNNDHYLLFIWWLVLGLGAGGRGPDREKMLNALLM